MDNYFYQTQAIEQLLNGKKISELKKDYKNLSATYRSEKINSANVVNSTNKALSYVSSRMQETSVIIDDVLNKLNSLVDLSGCVFSALDFGSGTGSALWALENFVKNIPVVAVEREMQMLNCAQELCKDLDLNITYLNDDVFSNKVKCMPQSDLVIESFMLNEMTQQDSQKALDLMIEKSKNFIVLIEPGTPNSYKKMMETKKYVLSKGLKIVLPCPHGQECGLKEDYCNFSVRVNRTKTSMQIKNATLGYEDEKYFYLIFSKNQIGRAHKNIIIRRPQIRKSCIDLKLCCNDTMIQNKTVTKKDKDNYHKAKHLKHGDIFE